MNKRIAKARKFVDENRTFLALCAGSVATSLTYYVLLQDKTFVNVSNAHQQLLKEGGGIVFDLKGETVHLVNLAAVEAHANL